MSTEQRTILVIGIGAGDPDHLTLQAVKAIRRADVFFIVGKGPDKASLTDLRHRMIEEHAQGPYRVVEVEDPARDRRPMDRSDYAAAVQDWRERRGEIFERAMREEMTAGETGPSSSGETRPCTTAHSASSATSRTAARSAWASR